MSHLTQDRFQFKLITKQVDILLITMKTTAQPLRNVIAKTMRDMESETELSRCLHEGRPHTSLLPYLCHLQVLLQPHLRMHLLQLQIMDQNGSCCE